MKISKQTKNFVLIVLSALLALTLALGLFTATQKPAYAEATLYDVTTPNETPFQAGWNNKTSGGNNYTVLYFTGVPMTTGVDVTYGTADGFNNGITLNYGGQTLTGAETGITYGGTLGGMDGYFYFKSSTSASYLSATGSNYATLTIPANTVVHNLTFKNELKYYFYSGAWSLEQPAVVETTPVDGVSIEKSWNNKVHGSDTVLTVYAWKSGVSGYVTPDTTANADSLATFNANIKLEYDGQTLTGANTGITMKPDKFASFKPGIVFGYSASAAFTAATQNKPAKMTISADSVLYNIEFTKDIVVYFYDGAWTLTEPEPSEEEEDLVATTDIESVSLEASWNNKEFQGVTVFVYYSKPSSDKLFTYDQTANANTVETFVDSLTLEYDGTTYTGETGVISVATEKIAAFKPGMPLTYAADAAFLSATAKNPAVLTIPANSVIYDIKYTTDIKFYFYDGAWNKTAPVVADYEMAAISNFQLGFTPKDYTTYKSVGMYFYQSTEAKINPNVVANSDTVETFLNTAKITYDGTTKTFKEAGIEIDLVNMAANAGANIWMFKYSNDAFFTGATANKEQIKAATITFPKDACLFNMKFEKDIIVYFYNGSWSEEIPENATPTDIKSLVLDATWKAHSKTHTYAGVEEGVVVIYAFSDVESQKKVTINSGVNAWSVEEINSVIKSNYDGQTYTGSQNTGLRIDPNRVVPFGNATVIAYSLSADFVNATAKKPLTVTIPKDSVYFNVKFTEDFNIYFYNGAWSLVEPFECEYDLSNLDNFTIGELVEDTYGKTETIALGDEYFSSNGASQGILNCANLLDSNNYAINFKIKVTSDYYAIKMVLHGGQASIEGGITIRFFNTEAGAVQMVCLEELDGGEQTAALYKNGLKFEKDVEYYVQVILSLDAQDLGAYLRVSVSETEFTQEKIANKTDMWGELHIPRPDKNRGMSAQLKKGFYLGVHDTTGAMYGDATVTNIDVNAPEISFSGNTEVITVNDLPVKAGVIESGVSADGYAYAVDVRDMLDGVVNYTATVINASDLNGGKFVENTIYQVKFVATDAAGNQMDKTLYFKCVYDCTAPVITLGNRVVDGRITLKSGITEEQVKNAIGATVVDGKDATVQLEYEFQFGALNENGNLNEGWFTLTITAVDDSGNESVEIINVVGDANAPSESTSEKDGGCGSSLSGTLIIAMVALLAAGVVIKSKKSSVNK